MSGDQANQKASPSKANEKASPNTNNEKIGKEEEYGYYFYPERGGAKLEKPWYTKWIGEGRATSKHAHCLFHVRKCAECK